MNETFDLINLNGSTTFNKSSIPNSSNYLNNLLEAKLVENILGLLNLSFIIIGTFGNLISFLILMRKNVRKHSCMRYLATLCLLDIFCLYTWNFSLVYSKYAGKKIEHEGAVICRIFSFFCYFILQSSSWIIVMIGMDRIITITVKKANKFSKLAKNTFIVTCSVLSVFFCFNFVVLVKNAEPINNKPDINKYLINVTNSSSLVPTRTYSCYEPRALYIIWDIVHIVFYSILPFFIILVENAFLSYLTIKHAKKMKKHNKNLSYPVAARSLSIDLEISTRKISLAETIVQRLDKRKRVYRKSKNSYFKKLNLTKLIKGFFEIFVFFFTGS